MKPLVLVVEKPSGLMEIRTAGTAPMHVMCRIGSGVKKKSGSLISAPLIVRRIDVGAMEWKNCLWMNCVRTAYNPRKKLESWG